MYEYPQLTRILPHETTRPVRGMVIAIAGEGIVVVVVVDMTIVLIVINVIMMTSLIDLTDGGGAPYVSKPNDFAKSSFAKSAVSIFVPAKRR